MAIRIQGMHNARGPLVLLASLFILKQAEHVDVLRGRLGGSEDCRRQLQVRRREKRKMIGSYGRFRGRRRRGGWRAIHVGMYNGGLDLEAGRGTEIEGGENEAALLT